MKKAILSILGLCVASVAAWAFFLTRDGDLVTPEGSGKILIGQTEFEEFPLPTYAAAFVNDEYKSYLIEVAPGIKVHVLEVGSGYPVYLQHGLPTSGFLFRQVADRLPKDEFRLIMPTLVGYGFSSKVPASQHSIENHITWMNAALTQLDLSELIFVAHDWGGPLGAGAVARSPELLKGMVVLNTVLAAPKEPRDTPFFLKVARTPVLGEILLEGLVSVFDQLPNNQKDPASFPPEVVELYGKPLSDSGNEKAVLAMMRMSVLSPDNPDVAILQSTEAFLNAKEMPVEIVWGTSDPILKHRMGEQLAVVPQANAVEVAAGHFLQEESPQEIAASVQRVLDQIER